LIDVGTGVKDGELATVVVVVEVGKLVVVVVNEGVTVVTPEVVVRVCVDVCDRSEHEKYATFED
jgi:hypothetical protein